MSTVLTDCQRALSQTGAAAMLDPDGIEALPAVRWKMKNLEQMRAPSHLQAYKKLEDVLHRLGRDEELE